MKRLLAIALLCLCAEPYAASSVETLDDLVRAVRESTERDQQIQRERERRFIEARDERRAMLEGVRSRRVAAEREADRLRAAFEEGEEALAELETHLDETSGDLREVFAVVHEVAGDTLPMLENSMVSVEVGRRGELLERLSATDTLPTAADMRSLWLLLLEEMNLSGKTRRFDTTVISAEGEEGRRQVTRVGTFIALSEGEYLRYLPESGRLLALARQPQGAQPSAVRAFEESEAPLSTIPVDPSRGSILALVVQRAGIEEQVQQGGLIGYIIILIGVIGVVLGIERLIVIGVASSRQKKALVSGKVDGKGALALMHEAAHDDELRENSEALSAKLDEIVATAAHKLNRGLPTLAIFAAVSPLLGLLGTVTGMIETFQVITLFGAGDPRLMSGGISQALITTQLGLAVAIPLLLIHSFVQGRANGMIAELDENAARLFSDERLKVEREHVG